MRRAITSQSLHQKQNCCVCWMRIEIKKKLILHFETEIFAGVQIAQPKNIESSYAHMSKLVE